MRSSSSGSIRIWYVLMLMVLGCGYVCFSLAYNSGVDGLFKDEATELLLSKSMPLPSFYFLIPQEKGGQTPPIESLIPYVNRLIFSIAGMHLVLIRLFFIACLALACCFFYRILERHYSQAYGVLGVVLLVGASYTGYYNQILERNGISLFWTCLIIWIMQRYCARTASGQPRARILAFLPLVMLGANLTYMSFRYIAVAAYAALFLWTLVYAPRWKESAHVLLSFLFALLLGYIVLIAGGSSVASVLSGGEYALIKGITPRFSLGNIVRSLLLPLRYPGSGYFGVEMTRIGFHRHTLSFVLLPFFIWGIIQSLKASTDKSGFQRLVLCLWLFSTALVSAGGPELKHQYAVFPTLILLSVFGLHGFTDWMSRRGESRATAYVLAAIVVIFLAGEMRHLYWANMKNEEVFLDKRMPKAVALQALESARALDKVYIVEWYGKDAIRFYIQNEPKVIYFDGLPERAYESMLISDIRNGAGVGIVTRGGVEPSAFNHNRDLSGCFSMSEATVNNWPVNIYTLREECRSAQLNPGGGRSGRDAGAAVTRRKFDMFLPHEKGVPAEIAKVEEPTRVVRAEGQEAHMLPGGRGGEPGQYDEPRGIAVDGRGNVYVADFRNYRIQKFDSKGNFVVAWGEAGNQPGQFKDPCAVAIDESGRVYVADTFNHRVQILDADGKVILQFKGGLFAPRGIAVDGSGRIWVADSGNNAVKLFSGEGELSKTVGKKGQGKGEFDALNGIATDRQGRLYVADAGNSRVQVFDGEGNYLSEFKVDGWQPGLFNEPYLAIDNRGDIYLTDPPGHRLLKYSQSGKLLGALKPMEGNEPMMSFPMGIALDPSGQTLYVVSSRNHRIVTFSTQDVQ
ncbi:MAG: 6-bladed beta-propeller [Candidatus Aureabacteria bacterium]|nr:6-bladed beta-propeller [Candidatus Auribacterota bacterium]